MIKTLSIRQFKSLNKVDLNLRGLNLFVGSNASGKSNFFDALRVLQGIGNGFTFREILDGKPRSATGSQWAAVRGGSVLARFQGAPKDSIQFAVTADSKVSGFEHLEYTVAFDPTTGRLTRERLRGAFRAYKQLQPIFDTDKGSNKADSPAIKAWYDRPGPGPKPHLEFDRSRSVLAQLPHHREVTDPHLEVAKSLLERLGNTQNLDPQPEVLRRYSSPGSADRMGERGENFAALVKTISDRPKSREAFVAWLRELRPAEVEDIALLTGALNDSVFALIEGGKTFPAPVLSDGTLRFAAITAAFFQPDMPNMLTIEEIEKGIHASRLRLLLELLKSQSDRGQVQIMATTHSRTVLDWLNPADFASTFFCHRDPQTGESHILPVSDVPNLTEATRTESLGDLFAENWLEAAT